MNKDKLNILFVTGIFPPDSGGPATYVKTVADSLSRKGHGVRVVTYGEPRTTWYRVFSIKRTLPWFVRHAFFGLTVFMNATWAGVIYAQDPLNCGIASLISGRFFRKNVVIKIVGDQAWEQQGRFEMPEPIDEFVLRSHSGKVGLMQRLQSFVARKADVVITPSTYLSGVVERWGVRPKKIHVVNNAVHKPEAELTKTQARSDLGISRGEFFVVSIGRDVPWKGFEVLRGAGDDLREAGEKVKLNIYSSVPREDVLKALAAADAFVLNTGYEGFSHVLIEAMAQGVPIITTDAGGNKEVVVDGVNGIFVPFNDKDDIKNAIVRLKGDAALRKKLSKNGKETAKKFTVERMVEETEKVLVENI